MQGETRIRSGTQEALYSRINGRRLPPERTGLPQPGNPMAIAVFDDGTSIPIFGATVIGRAPEDDWRRRSGKASVIHLGLAGQGVSRRHLLLRPRRWRLEAVDLGSLNGSAISGADFTWEPLTPGIGRVVRNGQELRLGQRMLTIHYV